MKSNIKYKKTRKNKIRKNRITRNKSKGRRTRSKRQGGMFRRFAKNLGKTALDVTTDVVTEVSKDQTKQLVKKAVTSVGKSAVTSPFSPNNYLQKTDTSFKKSPSFSSPTYEKEYKINFHDYVDEPTTPRKRTGFDTDVLYTPVKEKQMPEGSIAMRTADLTEVKKQLF